MFSSRICSRVLNARSLGTFCNKKSTTALPQIFRARQKNEKIHTKVTRGSIFNTVPKVDLKKSISISPLLGSNIFCKYYAASSFKEKRREKKIDATRRILAISSAEKYDIAAFSNWLQTRAGVDPKKRLARPRHWSPGVLHLHISSAAQSDKPDAPAFTQAGSEEVKDYFIFEEGVVVGWAITEDDAASLLAELKPFQLKPYGRTYSEHIHFEYDPSPDVDIVNDVVTVSSATEFNEKLALSHGIARSVKCDAIEDAMQKTITMIGARVPDYLNKGDLPPELSDHNQCSKQMAQVLYFRYLLNIESKVLEPPEYLWEAPEHEKLFEKMEKALEVKQRVSLANRKLDIAYGNLEVLMRDIHEKKVFRIEIIIALLITIEIVFHLLDKSKWWQGFTWEGLWRSVIG
jgi:uncharacterized Rmd1/YagE family protein